jgi:hypothetical protein
MSLEDLRDDFGEMPGRTLAWIGADGGAVVLGVNQLTDATLLADTGSPDLVAGAFLVAGGVGLASKLGFIGEE